MKKGMPRRDFLAFTGKLLAAGLFLPIGSMASFEKFSFTKEESREESQETSWEKVWEGKKWGFVVDTEKCIGCAKCVKACKLENNVPLDEEVYRTWVERYVVSGHGEVQIDSPKGGLDFQPLDERPGKQFFVPKLCNHCEHPSCVQVCPVGATYKTGDGVILVDRQRCVGCRYCIQACPYGARFFHPELHIVDKCTWCYHRIVQGLSPACVQVCPMGARKFGNLEEPDSIVSAIIIRERVRVLKPNLGNKPQVYYLGLDEVVV